MGVFCFFCGQLLRANRWRMLLPDKLTISNSNLLFFTSIGSLINVFFPFKIGDFIKGWLASKVEHIDFSTILVSILIERLTDVVVFVLLVLLGYYYFYVQFELDKELLIVIFSTSIFIFLLIFFKQFRPFLLTFSGIWNKRIQFLILNFFWIIFLQFRHLKILSLKFFSYHIIYVDILFNVVCFFFLFGK